MRVSKCVEASVGPCADQGMLLSRTYQLSHNLTMVLASSSGTKMADICPGFLCRKGLSGISLEPQENLESLSVVLTSEIP